jgi:hypothetical protein
MGKNGAPGGLYQIPFGTMVSGSMANTIVPVALSASHSAYASIRMEPQWMMLGQAAGVTAVQGMIESTPVQRVIPVENLKVAEILDTLRSQGAILDLPAL